jgi:hypothetical protein
VPLLALAVTLVGFVNARRVARVVKVEVPIAGLPERCTAIRSRRFPTSTSARPSSAAT